MKEGLWAGQKRVVLYVSGTSVANLVAEAVQVDLAQEMTARMSTHKRNGEETQIAKVAIRRSKRWWM